MIINLKKCLLAIVIFAYVLPVQGQKYFTREGKITFLSNAPMEEIKAVNERATSVFDFETGDVEWAVLVNAFNFKKALMEEHFNENYMESTKFPKASFKGEIQDLQSIPLNIDGTYETLVSGELEIRGIKKSIKPSIQFTVVDGKIKGTSSFTILVADYDISIPKVVRENIAKEVLISLEADYSPLN